MGNTFVLYAATDTGLVNEPSSNDQVSDHPVSDPLNDPSGESVNVGLASGRTVVLISDRLLFRKTFTKLLLVIDATLVVQELGSPMNPLPAADTGLVLIDAGGKDEDGMQLLLLTALTRQPEACILVVLDEQDDTLIDAAMHTGALGVMIKAAPPQVLIDMLQRGLNGDRFRPAPAVRLAREDLPEDMRRQLTARQQKLLRLMIGGHSISVTAAELGITSAKVVTEMRAVLGIVRGRRF